MSVPVILGLKIVLLLLVLVAFIEVRRKLKISTAKKYEIMRLVAMASEENAMAETEATISSVKAHHCAVCFCPTTMRCARCKVVRYCSRKCQIIHWRQGHQDECNPPMPKMQFEEGSDFGGKEESHFSNDLEMEDKQSIIFEALSFERDDAKVKPATFSHGKKVDFNSCENYKGNLGFYAFNTSGKPISDSIAPNIISTTVSINEMEVKNSSNPEHTNLVNSTGHASCTTKVQSNAVDDKMKSMSQAPKTKTLKPDNVLLASSGSKKQSKPNTLEEKLDVAMSRSFPSNDGKDDLRKVNCKEESFPPSSACSDQLFSTSGGHFVASTKSAKTGGNLSLPVKYGRIPSLSRDAQNSFKTSMQKFVQQFKPSKQSKCHISGFGSGVVGKYKAIFPYELFVKLYSHNLMILGAFGLINCGNSCYANAVLQCLVFTRPLTSYLLQGIHSKACKFLLIVKERNGVLSVNLNTLFSRQGKGSPHSPQFGYYLKYIRLEVILVMVRKKMPMSS